MSDLALIKEKILKLDSVFTIISEKNHQLKTEKETHKKLFSDYKEQCLKTEQLQNDLHTYKKLFEENSKLYIETKKSLDKLQPDLRKLRSEHASCQDTIQKCKKAEVALNKEICSAKEKYFSVKAELAKTNKETKVCMVFHEKELQSVREECGRLAEKNKELIETNEKLRGIVLECSRKPDVLKKTKDASLQCRLLEDVVRKVCQDASTQSDLVQPKLQIEQEMEPKEVAELCGPKTTDFHNHLPASEEEDFLGFTAQEVNLDFDRLTGFELNNGFMNDNDIFYMLSDAINYPEALKPINKMKHSPISEVIKKTPTKSYANVQVQTIRTTVTCATQTLINSTHRKTQTVSSQSNSETQTSYEKNDVITQTYFETSSTCQINERLNKLALSSLNTNDAESYTTGSQSKFNNVEEISKEPQMIVENTYSKSNNEKKIVNMNSRSNINSQNVKVKLNNKKSCTSEGESQTDTNNVIGMNITSCQNGLDDAAFEQSQNIDTKEIGNGNVNQHVLDNGVLEHQQSKITNENDLGTAKTRRVRNPKKNIATCNKSATYGGKVTKESKPRAFSKKVTSLKVCSVEVQTDVIEDLKNEEELDRNVDVINDNYSVKDEKLVTRIINPRNHAHASRRTQHSINPKISIKKAIEVLKRSKIDVTLKGGRLIKYNKQIAVRTKDQIQRRMEKNIMDKIIAYINENLGTGVTRSSLRKINLNRSSLESSTGQSDTDSSSRSFAALDVSKLGQKSEFDSGYTSDHDFFDTTFNAARSPFGLPPNTNLQDCIKLNNENSEVNGVGKKKLESSKDRNVIVQDVDAARFNTISFNSNTKSNEDSRIVDVNKVVADHTPQTNVESFCTNRNVIVGNDATCFGPNKKVYKDSSTVGVNKVVADSETKLQITEDSLCLNRNTIVGSAAVRFEAITGKPNREILPIVDVKQVVGDLKQELKERNILVGSEAADLNRINANTDVHSNSISVNKVVKKKQITEEGICTNRNVIVDSVEASYKPNTKINKDSSTIVVNKDVSDLKKKYEITEERNIIVDSYDIDRDGISKNVKDCRGIIGLDKLMKVENNLPMAINAGKNNLSEKSNEEPAETIPKHEGNTSCKNELDDAALKQPQSLDKVDVRTIHKHEENTSSGLINANGLTFGTGCVDVESKSRKREAELIMETFEVTKRMKGCLVENGKVKETSFLGKTGDKTNTNSDFRHLDNQEYIRNVDSKSSFDENELGDYTTFVDNILEEMKSLPMLLSPVADIIDETVPDVACTYNKFNKEASKKRKHMEAQAAKISHSSDHRVFELTISESKPSLTNLLNNDSINSSCNKIKLKLDNNPDSLIKTNVIEETICPLCRTIIKSDDNCCTLCISKETTNSKFSNKDNKNGDIESTNNYSNDTIYIQNENHIMELIDCFDMNNKQECKAGESNRNGMSNKQECKADESNRNGTIKKSGISLYKNEINDSVFKQPIKSEYFATSSSIKNVSIHSSNAKTTLQNSETPNTPGSNSIGERGAEIEEKRAMFEETGSTINGTFKKPIMRESTINQTFKKPAQSTISETFKKPLPVTNESFVMSPTTSNRESIQLSNGKASGIIVKGVLNSVGGTEATNEEKTVMLKQAEITTNANVILSPTTSTVEENGERNIEKDLTGVINDNIASVLVKKNNKKAVGKKYAEKKKSYEPWDAIKSAFKNAVRFKGVEEYTVAALNIFKTMDTGKLISYLLHEVIEDECEIMKGLSPFEPFLSITQKTVLGLLLHMEKSHDPNIVELFLTTCEHQLLFKEKDPLAVEHVVRLYASICKMRKLKSRLRRLIFDGLFFMGDLVLPLIYYTLTAWIQVLKRNGSDSDELQDPLAKVLIQVVHTKSTNLPEYCHCVLRNLLQVYYRYPKERYNESNLIKEFLEKFMCTLSGKYAFSILILCKNSKIDWVIRQLALVDELILILKDKEIIGALTELKEKIQRQIGIKKIQ